MSRLFIGLTLLFSGCLLPGCIRQTAVPPLRPAEVRYSPQGYALVSMDGKTFNYGFTGLERFCLSGANLDKLEQRSEADLRRLAGHYGLCLQDTNREEKVRRELARRPAAAGAR